MKPVVYVAGRFRGPDAWVIECNIRAAERLALSVWAAGGAALCPHANTRYFQGALPDDTWLEGDLAMLARCDALVTVWNWPQSEGAKAEVAFARERNIPVFHDLPTLTKWIHEKWLTAT